MECREWLKVGIEEEAAVGFTKCHSHFNLEIAEGDIKALRPESMQKPPPQVCIFFNSIYLFDKHAITELCLYSATAVFCLEWSFNDCLFLLFSLVL